MQTGAVYDGAVKAPPVNSDSDWMQKRWNDMNDRDLCFRKGSNREYDISKNKTKGKALRKWIRCDNMCAQKSRAVGSAGYEEKDKNTFSEYKNTPRCPSVKFRKNVSKWGNNKRRRLYVAEQMQMKNINKLKKNWHVFLKIQAQ